MKIMTTVLALTLSLSAFAEDSKTVKDPAAPTVSAQVIQKLRSMQQAFKARYLEILRAENKKDADLTPEERAEYERQATM